MPGACARTGSSIACSRHSLRWLPRVATSGHSWKASAITWPHAARLPWLSPGYSARSEVDMAMMKRPWTPWRDVVQVRDDLKTGKLSLSEFAADLYDVVMHRKDSVYHDPTRFFSLTYPTLNLRELARDV